MMTLPKLQDISPLSVTWDMVTRFSGIGMSCVITGVIEPS
jgi:hypothetical protein